MNKQTIWGVVGILLSCLCIVFGWFFTVTMLSQNETALLLESGTTQLTQKAPNTSQGVAGGDVSLTLAEIVRILGVWETQSNIIPHEPSNGQLTMEQAVAVGNDWLIKLSAEVDSSLFPEGAKMSAFLCADEPAVSALVIEIPSELGAIRQQEELAPYFSYWTVHFAQEQYDATLIINSVTKEVWSAEIKLSIADASIDIDIEKALSTFLEPLALAEDSIIVRDGQTASHSFGNGALLGIAETSSTADTQTIKLYLTTQ